MGYFLLAWEATSILSYLLIVFANRVEERGGADAGYLLLAAGGSRTPSAHSRLRSSQPTPGGSISSRSTGRHWTREPGLAVFLLSFFGFRVKAGLVPVNFRLPRAYTVAPRAFAPVFGHTETQPRPL